MNDHNIGSGNVNADLDQGGGDQNAVFGQIKFFQDQSFLLWLQFAVNEVDFCERTKFSSVEFVGRKNRFDVFLMRGGIDKGTDDEDFVAGLNLGSQPVIAVFEA